MKEKIEYESIIQSVKSAGAAILDLYPSIEVSYTKQTLHQVVTKADIRAQSIIVEAIKNHFPNHGIVSEEQEDNYQPNAPYIWYVDPLDGTRNFACHVPIFGINAGLALDGKVIFGVTYLPATDELCTAEIGRGAFLNGKRVVCSTQSSWEYSIGIGPIGLTEKSLDLLQIFSTLSNGTAWVNSIGSPAASGVYLASGRRDWYGVRSKEPKTWDWAAPSILMKEAGCLVTNAQGEDWCIEHTEMLAANPSLHPELIQALKQK